MAAGALVFAWLFRHKPAGTYLLWTALGLLLAGAFSPLLARLIATGWMALGKGMGWFTSKVLLTVVFFVFLFPLSLLYRLSRKDVIPVRRNSASSYYKTRKKEFTAADFDKTW